MTKQTAILFPEVTVGTIFSSSWGYDQTNVDFYQVVKRTAKQVVIRPISAKSVEEGAGMSEYVAPVKDEFIGEAFRKSFSRHSNTPILIISSYASAHLTSEDSKHFTSSWY